MMRALRFLLAVVTLATLFAACASNDGGGVAPTPNAADAGASAETGSLVPGRDAGATNVAADAAPSAQSDAAPPAPAYPAFVSATYFKAPNPWPMSYFGFATALSGDGTRLAVGARGENSAAKGINQDGSDQGAAAAGSVTVFAWDGAAWKQEAYIKASNTESADLFGTSLALSADGSRLAVGASGEDSAATGVNGDQADNSAPESGAVYVFARTGTTWTQEAYVKASNTGSAGSLKGDNFGISVSLSDDGTRLAVGANGESSNATGVNGNQADNSVSQAGAAYVFVRSGTTWTQEAYVKASNPSTFDHFGWSVALSGDATRLAVGAIDEASNAKGIDGNQADDSLLGAGAVYVFARSGTSWAQEAYVKASNTALIDQFGYDVALSADGSTLAVGASMEQSSATGIDGNGDQTTAPQLYSGAAYVFRRSGTTWTQEAYVKASNTWTGAYFGLSVSLSSDGNRLAVGAPHEDSGATGINGNQNDGSAKQSGAAYVFSRSGATWSQDAYVKASNTDAYDEFGSSVSLSADGVHLAIGARMESSNASGVNGNQSDNSAGQAGAAYVY